MEISADKPLKIGTRGSPLALAQARETRARLMAALNLPEDVFDICVIKTTGDRIQDRPLGEIGGKGLFTKEIEDALLNHDIDIAVHSMKDMPVDQPKGLILSCYLPREDVRDAFISHSYTHLSKLPHGAKVGTSSLRRRAQVLNIRPDLNMVEFRGNVQTRLRKLDEGLADATFLAMAGLHRLGQSDLTGVPIEPKDMLPAIAQGAIGIEQRQDDTALANLLGRINDQPTTLRLWAERALLRGLDGSCQTPIAGLAILTGNQITLHGQILRPDGSQSVKASATGPTDQATNIGENLAQELLKKSDGNFF